MRPIIIGAGRGRRLGPETERVPKTMVPVLGRPMIEWILEALDAAGFVERDVVFVCGYAEDVIRQRYPDFTFVRNPDWRDNNILLSLLHARSFVAQGCLTTYSDIVYEGDVVKKLVDSEHDITIGCDTAWRRRYESRSEHPETDAEKLVAHGSRVVELSRTVDGSSATGEFIGVMKLTPEGARRFLQEFDDAARRFTGRVWREGRTFEKAYLIDLLQHMLERDVAIHRVDTDGGYMEIDTREDLAMAGSWWTSRDR